MPGISRKAASFGESVIRAMTRVANRYGAINLSQGFPDFDPPPELLAAAERAAREGPHQYAVTWGAQDFREALAAKQSRFMGIPVDPDLHVVATCGSTEAMMAAVLATVDPGDRVVVFSPFYENYRADAILSGAEPVCVELRAPDFSFDPGELDRALDGAKALILCNPANPTGKVFSRGELATIAEIAEKRDALVITDEVYEHIVYAPRKHVYFASLPGMFEEDDLVQLPLEDLLDHRMAARLRDRSRPAGRRHQEGPRLPDRRRGGAAPGRGGDRARPP